MPPKEYAPGDTVFAKLKGYPWWPARVEDDNKIPAKVLKQKTKTKSPLYTVFFYGSRDYGFFGPDCIRPFNREAVESDLKANKFKTKDLEHAVHQALDPSILEAEEEAEKREKEEEEEEKRRKKAGRKKTATTKKTAPPPPPPAAAAATKRKAPQKKTTDNNDNNKSNNKTKRARSEEPSEVDRKKRRKSLSTEQEDNASLKDSPSLLRKSEEPQQQNGTDKASLDLEVFKKTPEYKKVYHSRHRLQKLIYEKKAGEIAKDEYARIAQVVKEIEETEMTYDLLRYTKIGKVVKYGCGYTFEDDEHDIQARCLQLMKRWKNVLLVGTERQAAEQQETSNGNHA
ncbi:Tudor/PWWP/MBT [Backusella circina FSU 941]|nr:Tudor/PWWP/MBT [Backusella circina FSU 941]